MPYDPDNPFRDDQMYTIAEVCGILKITRVTWYRKVADGLFPEAVKFKSMGGPRIPGRRMREWYEKELAEARTAA